MSATEPEPAFGIYVHWPFCLRSARIAISTPMCATRRSTRSASCAPSPARSRRTAALTPGRTVSSIFLGGGTPSLMQPQTVGADPRCDRQSTGASRRDAEVTLEANPTSVEADALSRLSRGRRQPRLARRAGARRRLAEGARPHAHRARGARRGGDRAQRFPALLVRPDLCAARIRRVEAWTQRAAAGDRQGAEHLSLYQLTIEPETPFAGLYAAGKLVIPDEGNAARAL